MTDSGKDSNKVESSNILEAVESGQKTISHVVVEVDQTSDSNSTLKEDTSFSNQFGTKDDNITNEMLEKETSSSLIIDSRPKHPPSTMNDILFERPLPRVNCKEKIVICVDLSSDMLEPPFKYGDGTKHSPLMMVKKIIEIFVSTKHRLNDCHEFALVILLDKAYWHKDFTTDPKEIFAALKGLECQNSYDQFDLSSLFELLSNKVLLPPSVGSLSHILPPFVVRTLLIYGRSSCMPSFLQGDRMFERFQQSPFFFLDILYIHVPPSPENSCQEIFEALCDLDERYTSYIFEVTRNVTKLHNCMAKFLCHPLQRALQNDAFYKLNGEDDVAESPPPTPQLSAAVEPSAP